MSRVSGGVGNTREYIDTLGCADLAVVDGHDGLYRKGLVGWQEWTSKELEKGTCSRRARSYALGLRSYDVIWYASPKPLTDGLATFDNQI
jgi:hypothetical protein